MRFALVLCVVACSSKSEQQSAQPPAAPRCADTACQREKCEHGDAAMCVAAEKALAKSIDPNDRERGMIVLGKACELGNAESCMGFANALESGVYVEPDAARAKAIRKKLCDANNADACAWIAATSRDVPKGEQDKLLKH